MEFLQDQPHDSFMRYSRILNAISLITFVIASAAIFARA